MFCEGIFGLDHLGQLELNESVEEMAQELRVGNKFRYVAERCVVVIR